tara:strand:- start:2155 stop:2358 length:204 start_codon:yes stop_codon:yes gene_type:complete
MKVIGHPDFRKDEVTGAIVNSDKSAFEAYKRQRALAMKSLSTAEELNNLKQEMNEIKSLLKEVLSKL